MSVRGTLYRDVNSKSFIRGELSELLKAAMVEYLILSSHWRQSSTPVTLDLNLQTRPHLSRVASERTNPSALHLYNTGDIYDPPISESLCKPCHKIRMTVCALLVITLVRGRSWQSRRCRN